MREVKFRERLKDSFHYWGFIELGFIGPVSPLNHSDQFTGLYDKNGKEIFEGDIIDIGYDDEGCRILEKVKFEDGIFYSGDELLYDDCKDGKIVGNVYENPELLEEKK